MKIQNPTRRRRFRAFFHVGLTTAALLAVMVLCCTIAQAQTGKIRASHENMDPKATTDEFGLTVPIPIDFPARRFPAEDGFPTGPAIGEPMPDFELPNQHGETINFQKARGGKKAAVVFFRSAVW